MTSNGNDNLNVDINTINITDTYTKNINIIEENIISLNSFKLLIFSDEFNKIIFNYKYEKEYKRSLESYTHNEKIN